MIARFPFGESFRFSAGVGPRIRFTVGQLEALKWLALASMLVEHFVVYLPLPGREPAIMVGRLAFPLFAVAFAFGVAGSATGGDSARRAAFRLLPFAILAQVFSELVRNSGLLNILFQFLAVAAWVAAGRLPRREMLATRALCLLVALLSEYWLPGFFMSLAAYRVAERPNLAWILVGLGAMLFIAWEMQVGTAFLALPIAWLVSGLNLPIPRIRNFFGWAYVAQFPAILAWWWVM